MMDSKPASITSQVKSLHELGYSHKEIYAELKLRPGMGSISKSSISAVLSRLTAGRGEDSRRIFEIWEAQNEILGLLREIVSERTEALAKAKIRKCERDRLKTG
jgi:hypothetical protein